MTTPGAPPSDAIVLFDGKDLSKWGHRVQGQPPAQLVDAKWVVRDGYFEVPPARAGDMFTRESFGDAQIHLEWAAPAVVSGTSQGRGNSGLKIMGLYEIQILDSVNNPTYADGQAAAIYGQWPPLVNAARKPGDWQTYDIVFEAPTFDGDKVAKPAFVTVIWNGVAVHVRKELIGTTINRQLGRYTAACPRAAADAAGPRQPRPLPERLGAPPGRIRSKIGGHGEGPEGTEKPPDTRSEVPRHGDRLEGTEIGRELWEAIARLNRA